MHFEGPLRFQCLGSSFWWVPTFLKKHWKSNMKDLKHSASMKLNKRIYLEHYGAGHVSVLLLQASRQLLRRQPQGHGLE
jgi:hypothetical protein